MSFIDEVKLHLKAGKGGDGCVSFRREKFIEFGGPNGGNGGKGGDIIFVVNKHINTLLTFRYQQHIKAANGQPGAGQNKTGPSGQDIILEVPLGTQIFDEEGELLVDLNTEHSKFIAARGGLGGAGNSNYKTSTNRAPRYFTYGKLGDEVVVWLKLKVISDVGIIGLPNAGKSKFLSRCSRADIKVADYPFTTLKPNLGVANIDEEELVLADIPGLIENAHLGAGLGHKFLKHIERCLVLLHLIDISNLDVINNYECIRNELNCYSRFLGEKEEIVVLNKCDLVTMEVAKAQQEILSKHLEKEVFLLSIHDDVKSILRILKKIVNKYKNTVQKTVYDPFSDT